jgi:peptidoglycan/xylan/chitin deacetylase (PgdA/CDA1 family)
VKLTVLQYHKLHSELADDDTVTTTSFRRQLAFLKQQRFNPISCRTLYNYLMKIGDLPSNPVLITFDGGHISQFTHGVRILEAFSFQATFFIYVEELLSSDRIDTRYPQAIKVEQINALQEIGFEVGLHGYTHLSYRKASLRAIRADISKGIYLLNKFEIPFTNVIAYPNGLRPALFWNIRKLDKILKQEKVMLAFSKGNAADDTKQINRFNIHRIEVNGKDSDEIFLKKLS